MSQYNNNNDKLGVARCNSVGDLKHAGKIIGYTQRQGSPCVSVM